jgi:hypothetical protein
MVLGIIHHRQVFYCICVQYQKQNGKAETQAIFCTKYDNCALFPKTGIFLFDMHHVLCESI